MWSGLCCCKEMILALPKWVQDHIFQLFCLRAQNRISAPDAWHRAEAGLLAISVLQELYLSTLLFSLRPYICLESSTRLGFRPTYQADELQTTVKQLITKYQEWGLSLNIIKLEIRKAYDTLSHRRIDESMRRRKVPRWLRAAYWHETLSRFVRYLWVGSLQPFCHASKVSFRAPQNPPVCMPRL